MIYIATERGVYRWFDEGRTLRFIGLAETAVRDVAPTPSGTIVALDRTGGVWQTFDGGVHWSECGPEGIPERPTALLAVPESDVLYLGTAPPALYRRSLTRSAGWERVAALSDQPFAQDWYSPEGQVAVRTLAVAPKQPEQLYLDIHVGGVVRTGNAGRTWEPVCDGLELDVHEICTTPAAPEALYAATADGFYYSPDGGDRWEARNKGLSRLYCRAIATHPEDANVALISGSPTPPPGWKEGGKRFGLFRTTDGGAHWELVAHGLPPECEDEIDTRSIGFSRAVPGQALCGYRSGELFASENGGGMWQPVAENLTGIRAVVPV